MKGKFTHILGCIILPLISITASSQSIALKSPQTPVIIDGNKNEWGDNLLYNAEKNIYYAIANDKQNLYLVIKSTDLLQQSAILSSGITFSIDTKGKKKRSFSITFPMAGLETASAEKNSIEEKRLRAELTKLKKIGIKGFKDIDEDEINTENAFNIQTAINFDDNGDLIFEEAIPLKLFHADEAKNEWAFNIKINALTGSAPQQQPSIKHVTSVVVAVPAGSGPPSKADVEAAIRNNLSRGGLPSSIPRSDTGNNTVELLKATDFWGSFTLADVK